MLIIFSSQFQFNAKRCSWQNYINHWNFKTTYVFTNIHIIASSSSSFLYFHFVFYQLDFQHMCAMWYCCLCVDLDTILSRSIVQIELKKNFFNYLIFPLFSGTLYFVNGNFSGQYSCLNAYGIFYFSNSGLSICDKITHGCLERTSQNMNNGFSMRRKLYGLLKLTHKVLW